jgi:CheY-like chemotaxis protein
MIAVLLVDDMRVSREILKVYFAGQFEVYEAAEGQAALTMLESRPLDVVITDLRMPVMDGLELTRRIRAHPRFSRLPIIVLTGESDVRASIDLKTAGASATCSKPIDPRALIALVQSVLSSSRGSST